MSTDKKERNRVQTAAQITVLTALFAALIAVCSIISIPVGQVPITLQTFAVCLSAYMLGTRRGMLSVLVYILLGAVGLPVFAGMKGGLGVLAGPTGGYIVGFLLTALVIGMGARAAGQSAFISALFMAAGVLACYVVGTLWFIAVTGMGVTESLALCVVPFLLPDAVKIAAAVLLGKKLKKVFKT